MWPRIRNWFAKPSSPESPVRARKVAWAPPSKLPVSPRSRPLYEGFLFGPEGDYGPPPGLDPRILFPFLRRLRDTIPDVSAGVWAWVRLCSTPQSYSLSEGSEAEQARARAVLDALDRRLVDLPTGQDHGVEALVQCFFLSVFTYGAFCGEVVLEDSRRRIDRFLIIDPATIRFRPDARSRRFLPFQIQGDGTLTPLHPASFFYFGLDTDGLSPYGRSPLLALPLVVKLQQQMLRDMARAQHNAGYPMVHFQMAKPEPGLREQPGAYNARMQEELEALRSEVRERETDSNLVTFDNVRVSYIGPDGYAHQWEESLRAIGEQVISALHLAPFMLGRNWGTTESWGTAQYQLLTNNARTVQEGAKRLAEWLRNLELALQGSPLSVRHHFAPHHHLDADGRARALQTTANTLVALAEKGLLDSAAARQRIETLLRFY
ncbi:MAG TPA: hypothetical protein PLX83_10785 [bacterium]|nr:hypothetical protein [bacterium]